ncbi:MAG: molybdopterin oxidoreductase family protein, partial [Deinococcus sp.]|nr:molybdopterin oxidoreductase family protein [Deinococcus sp.]
NKLGASILDRNICATDGGQGYRYNIGATIGVGPLEFERARLIIIWGSNVVTSNVHLWAIMQQARRQGAKLIVIDPWRNRTAAQADWYLQILPGTDAALALGMMHLIFKEGLQDDDYLEKYTVGAKQLKERAKAYPPERVARITGLAVNDIVTLARQYATTRPAAIRVNYGLSRHAGGGMAVRTISCLPAVIGAWREPGGGVLLSTSGTYPLNYAALERPDLILPSTRTMNMSALGDALTGDVDPPVQALYVYNSNPAAVAPEQEKVVKGLLRPDLFTVVHEQFLTDTTDYADIVLPATTQLEHFDLMRSYGHLYLLLNQPAIAPLGQAKCNSDVFRLLAERLGLDEPCLRDSDEEMAAQALSSKHPALSGITLERLKRDGWVRLNVPEPFIPFAQGNFPTPSGKCELSSQAMADAGFDPLPSYNPPAESQDSHPELAKRYPLALISPPAHHLLNSSFSGMPRHRQAEGGPSLEIHPLDAVVRRIRHGQLVKIYNDRGTFFATACVTERTRAGVVVAPSIWWNKHSPGGCNVNATTSQLLTDMGRGATFYDNLVEVSAT